MPLKQPSHLSNPSGLPSKYILIGEDDIDDVDMLKEVFSTVDDTFSLKFVHSGKKIIETLEHVSDSQLPCLIVLDYNMPELNGAEILRYLGNSPRYQPIPKVIWSTSASSIYRSICIDLGANDYVIKPASLQEFVQVARHMLSFC